MKHKIITSRSAHELNQKIAEHLKENWIPVGSHQVINKHMQNRFAGMQHRDSVYEIEYSQTIQSNGNSNK